MKKSILFFVVILSLLQVQKAHAQMAVVDAAVTWTLEKLGLEQALATAQMIEESIQQGLTMYYQLENLKQMAEDSLKKDRGYITMADTNEGAVQAERPVKKTEYADGGCE